MVRRVIVGVSAREMDAGLQNIPERNKLCVCVLVCVMLQPCQY